MKNTIKYIALLLVVFSITLISCEKETDDKENPDNTATCRLKKAANSAGDITYTYNADNEITVISFGTAFTVEVTYNTTGQLASVFSNFGNEITTDNYQYNTSDQPISAISTMVEPDGTTTTYPVTFTHTDDKLTEIKAVITAGGGTLTTIGVYTYDGDNVSSMVEQHFFNTTLTSTDTTIYLEYDNKKNPLSELGKQTRYTMFQGASGQPHISKNNCIKIEKSDGTVTTTTLEYNANNYPIKATEDGNVATLTYYPCE